MKLAFEDFVLDTDLAGLSQGGQEISVEPKVFDLLRFLIENRGRVWSKDDLVEQVWEGRFISDAAVSSCVKMLRRVLGDDGEQQRLIRTQRGRGFRFVAEVEEIVETPATPPAVRPEPAAAPASAVPPALETEPQAHPFQPRKPSIVVLPLQSLTLEGPEHVLSEAVPHELIQALSRLRWLRVIARGSSFRFRGPDPDLSAIGSQLAVRYVLSGTIDRFGETLVFTIELSDCETGDVVWAERFEARPEALHEMRHEVVARVIASLEIYIPLNEATRAQMSPADSLDAWANYHLGLRYMFRFTKEDNDRATGYFNQAIAQDPVFARAHAGLSFTRFQDAFVDYTADTPAAIADARRYAERSVELDPLDPFSNFTMGRAFWLEGDPASSLSWLERSVSLSPNFAQGYYSRAFAQVIQCQARDALENAEKARDLSPLDPFLYGVHGVRAMASLQAGDSALAMEEADKAARAPGAHFLILMIAAMVHSVGGDRAAADHWGALARDRRPDASRQQFFTAFPFAEPTFHKMASDGLARIGF